jgi:hypothetical protein
MTPLAPLARPSVAVDGFRAEHDFWHGEFIEHRCGRCDSGGRCRVASYLADMADDYGKKVVLAEERAEREARR